MSLCQFRHATYGTPIYVNALNVTTVEPYATGGTRIFMSGEAQDGGKHYTQVADDAKTVASQISDALKR